MAPATLQAEASTCSGTCSRSTAPRCAATTAAAKGTVWSPKGLGRDPMTFHMTDGASGSKKEKNQNNILVLWSPGPSVSSSSGHLVP